MRRGRPWLKLGVLAVFGLLMGVLFWRQGEAPTSPTSIEVDTPQSVFSPSNLSTDGRTNLDSDATTMSLGDRPRAAFKDRSEREFRILVLDSLGAPISGARVDVFVGSSLLASEENFEQFQRLLNPVPTDTARTDATGRGVVRSATLGSWIKVSAAGFEAEEWLLNFTRNSEMVVRLSRTCRLQGWVRDREGNPVEGAEIISVATREKESSKTRITVGDTVMDLPSRSIPISDAQGGFTIESPPGAEFWVHAQKGLAHSNSVRVDCSTEPRLPLSLVMDSQGSLKVTVLDPGESPVPGAQVEIVVWPPQESAKIPIVSRLPSGFSKSVKTDVNGQAFLSELASRSYAVLAASPAFASSIAMQVRLETDDQQSLILRLRPASYLKGIVRRSNGTPAPGVPLRATPERVYEGVDEEPENQQEGSGVFFEEELRKDGGFLGAYQTTTGEDGTFRLGPTPEGEEQRVLILHSPGQMILRRVVPGVQDVEIILQDQLLRGGTASLTILDASGAAMAAARYRVFHSPRSGRWDSSSGSGIADYRGRVYLTGLIPGDRYLVEILGAGRAPFVWGPWIAEQRLEKVIQIDLPVDVEIEWQGGAPHVEDPAISWQHASLQSQRDNLVWNVLEKEQRRVALTPGRYRFRLLLPSEIERIVEIEVRAEKTNSVVF